LSKGETVRGRAAGGAARLALVASIVSIGVWGQQAAARGQTFAQSSGPVIVSLTLDGTVDPITADYITSNVARAQSDGAEAVLLTMNTPGGLGSSMDEITQSFLTSTIPVIAYVAPSGARAASAGAFILLSAPVAAMAPGTNVGASTPIGLSGGDLSGTLGEKIKNDATAKIQSLAQTYHRNADVAATFVTDAASITSEQALQDGVIDLVSPSVQDLLAQLDGKSVVLGTGQTVTLHTANAQLQEEHMGAFVGFLHTLLDPNLAFIFFWLGLGLIILWLIVPHHVVSGLIGLAMFVLAIVSFGILPVRLIGILLLVVSVVAFILELKAPGLGVWGAIGLITLVLGGWFLYDRAGGVEVSPLVIVAVAAFAGLFFGIVVGAAIKMRNQPSLLAGLTIVGAEGVALPSGIGPKGGIVRVSAEEWNAVSPAAPIPGNAKIKVTAIDGLVLTVEPVSVEHPQAGPQAPANEGGTRI
jgi:membrane-bound serine protease (ClpP class)